MALSAYVDEFTRQPWPGLALLSGVGFAFLLLADGHHQPFAVAWAVMLLAMMPVLVAHPISHIQRSSRSRRLIPTLIEFGVGYALVWMAAGPLLLALSRLFGHVPGGSDTAPVAAVMIALAWSASPWHQTALNRAHAVTNLAVFGWRAQRDACRYGLVHGAWCIGSCWTWMLVPLTMGAHHGLPMVLVTLILLIERLAMPARPKWTRPLLMRLMVERRAYV